MQLDAALTAASEALTRVDADVVYWMQQYKRAVEDVHQWVEAAAGDEPDTAPRYRLLQQTLQDTRYGLDYAVRGAAEARQELANARQFYLAMKTGTLAVGTPTSTVATSTSSPNSSAVPFRIRSTASTVAQPTPSTTGRPDHVELQRREEHAPPPPPPSAGAAPIWPESVSFTAADDKSTTQPALGTDITTPERPRSSVRVSPLKRSGGETVYLVPAKRAKYSKAFKWDDNLMHHFPKDFTLPVCTLATMWTYWVCGDASAKYPPFRILVAPELEEPRTKRMLSALRFVMLEIEARVLAQGTWVNNPSVEEAAAMLDTVKESIAARPAAKRGELQPVGQLQWTSLGRILRDQKKMREGEGKEDDDDEE